MRLVPIFGLALAAAIATSVLPVSSSYAETYSRGAQDWAQVTGLSHVTHPDRMRHSGAQRGPASGGSPSAGRGGLGHGGLGHGGRGHGGGGHGGGGHGR